MYKAIVLAFLFSLPLFFTGCSGGDVSTITDTSKQASAEASADNPCTIGTPITGKLYVKGHDIPMYTGPGSKFPKVINQKFTEISGKTDYRTLDPAYTLEGFCQKDKWIQAKIIEVDGKPEDWEKGWVNKKYLSGNISSDHQAGLLWDIDHDPDLNSKEKKLFRKAAMRVLKDEPNCKEVVMGGTGDKQGEYFISCNARSDDQMYNVFFTVKQLANGTSLATPQPFPEDESRQACENAIRGSVSHPSTLNIHRILGYATTTHNNGNRTIMQDFSAKNGFGLELKYEAHCLVMPDGKVELEVKEAESQ